MASNDTEEQLKNLDKETIIRLFLAQKEQLENLDHTLQLVLEQLADLKRHRFGRSTERHETDGQIQFMESNNYAFSMTAYSLMDLDGKSKNKILYMPKSMSYAQYLRNTAIGCLTVVIDKEKTGAFETPNIRTSQDMALWLVILKRGFKIYALNENLASYRLVPTSNSAKKMKAIKDVWRVYRELERLSFIYAAFNFCGYMYHAVLKRL